MIDASTLEGQALDAAVELALGSRHLGAIGSNVENDKVPWCLSGCNDWWESADGHKVCGGCYGWPRSYSTEWERGGPIIERERISIEPWFGTRWNASCRLSIGPRTHIHAEGPSALIAAMRAFVASRSA